MKKPFKCPFCWNRYGYEHSRNLHIKEDHRALIQHARTLKDLTDVVQIISPSKEAIKSRAQTVQILPYQNYTIIRTDNSTKSTKSTNSSSSSRSIGSSSPETIHKPMIVDDDDEKLEMMNRPIRVPVIQVNPFYQGKLGAKKR